MIVYRLWDITEKEKKQLLLETIDKRELDRTVSDIRDKMLDTDTLIMLEQKQYASVDEYFD